MGINPIQLRETKARETIAASAHLKEHNKERKRGQGIVGNCGEDKSREDAPSQREQAQPIRFCCHRSPLTGRQMSCRSVTRRRCRALPIVVFEVFKLISSLPVLGMARSVGWITKHHVALGHSRSSESFKKTESIFRTPQHWKDPNRSTPRTTSLSSTLRILQQHPRQRTA